MNIVEIKLEKLKIHPKNIRKEYEGIDELAQSIKENGIMQNLTVVPDPEEAGTYFVVIGNRRLTAARQAGIESAPCIIVEDMSAKNQIATMLTENMNRKDLKIYEEAAAVQMCLKDFGFGMEEMEQKTGLSKTTLYHRLNLAKLNQNELKKKANDNNFQLSLNDLYALEKIEDVKVRNRLLKESTDSRDLINKIRNAENEQTCAKNAAAYEELFKKRGIAHAPKGAENELYSYNKWHTVNTYYLLEKPPKRLMLKTGELFWLVKSRYLYIIEKAETVKKEKKALTKEDLEKKALEQNIKEIRTKYKEMFEDMGDYIRSIIAGKVPMVDNAELLDLMIWNHIIDDECWISMKDIVSTLLGAEYWSSKISPEDRLEAAKKAKTIPVILQKLSVAYWKMKDLDIIDYRGIYKEESGKRLKRFFHILELFGYCWLDDEMREVANGTDSRYRKQEEK